MLSSRQTRLTHVSKVLNLILVLALLLGLLPRPAQAATAQQAAPASRACTPSASTDSLTASLFLPAINQGNSDSDAPVTAPRILNYVIGQSYVYEWKLGVTTQAFTQQSEGLQDAGNTALVVDALVEVNITGQDSEGNYQGHIVVRDPFLCQNDGVNDTVLSDEAMTAALATPMHFVQARNGVIQSIAYAEDAPNMVINLQKGVVNALQATLQEDAERYSVQEQGGQGTYTAHYTVAPQAGRWHITRSYTERDFSERVVSGDDEAPIRMIDHAELVLDSSKGVFSTIRLVETIATGSADEFVGSEADYAGINTWSEIHSDGALTLKKVKAVDAGATQAAAAAYVSGNLSAILAEPELPAFDPTTMDLEAEFATLEAAAGSQPMEEPVDLERMMSQLMRIAELIEADPSTLVLDMVRQRLTRYADNPAMATLYLDVLGMAATPSAQTVLAEILSQPPTVQSSTVATYTEASIQEQALFRVVQLQRPSGEILQAVQKMANDANLPLNAVAVTVLGAAIGHLRDEDPVLAEGMVDQIEAKLAVAASSEERERYLMALGNAGSADSMALIASYLPNGAVTAASGEQVNEDVQAAAVMALRKMPDAAAEQALFAIVNDLESSEYLRTLAANMLAERGVTSELAAQALDASHTKDWSRWWGGSKLGVKITGAATAKTPPHTGGLLVLVNQDVDGYVWNKRVNLVAGNLYTRRSGSRQQISADVSVGNNWIKKEYFNTLACRSVKSGSLYQGNVTFYSFKKSIPVVWIITIDITIKVSGTFSLTYNIDLSACNPSNMQIKTGITPRGYVQVKGEASLSLQLARGGVGISAKILDTWLPSTVTVSYTSARSRVCFDVKAYTRALNARLYGFGDVRAPRWGWPPYYWKREFDGSLASFKTSSGTYTLFPRSNQAACVTLAP